MEFLNDIKNYIPLGSLTASRIRVPGGSDPPLLEWKEASETAWFWHHTLADWYALITFGWIRVFVRKHQEYDDMLTLRIFILPDDVGRRYLDRSDDFTRKNLIRLMEIVDFSLDSWEGRNGTVHLLERPDTDAINDDSLFYLFNTLPAPSSTVLGVSCKISKGAMQSLTDERTSLLGLKTKLYPYQQRSAATMIRREVEPALTLDPRLELFEGATGQKFYYDKATGVLLREKRAYEESRGGILAETMGLGKTLICLATILATKGHWPQIPPEYSIGHHPVRPKTGTLMQMAAAAVGRKQIPWRTIFQSLPFKDEDNQNCLAILDDNIGSYTIPSPSARRSRRSLVVPKGQLIRLCSATLIIVPPNLLNQWKNEAMLHLEQDALRVLWLDTLDAIMPTANELLLYDAIVMTKQRFEREMMPGDRNGKSTKNGAHCKCPYNDGCKCSVNDQYHTPLKDLHFLRLIVDEGHDFASSGGKKNAIWALQSLHVERKWIVSGTPASGLHGVEVGAAVFETSSMEADKDGLANASSLEARRKDNALMQEHKDLDSLGRIVVDFLHLRPWANDRGGEDRASWQKYVMPQKDGTRKRKGRSLRAILESLVVRHRIEDIEADIQLPPLYNRVIYLQPSWHDKLSINLFIFVLTANAVTSERTDQDYMFHAKNKRRLNELVTNLRRSGFFWTSFTPQDIQKTLDVCKEYIMENEVDHSPRQKSDFILLKQAIEVGSRALESTSWTAFAGLHEIGFYVKDFPQEARDNWSLVKRQPDDPLLVGATHLSKAQKFVDSRLYSPNPANGLATVGESIMLRLQHNVESKAEKTTVKYDDQTRATQPPSSVGAPKLTAKQTLSSAKPGVGTGTGKRREGTESKEDPVNSGNHTGLKSALKSSSTDDSVPLFQPDSALARTQIFGTASAKLSYLLDRVIALQQEEKTIIFYEGDHIAYYIAQALDLVNVRYLIYTTTLPIARLSAYITTFNTTETFRVLLMNVHQAALGLHIASASRVFFVNPVWQPNVEAQAIKRAHRIGQSRPVYVETLVLKDTLEDQMLQRRKGMTTQEHQKSAKSLLDDPVMGEIIRNATFIPLSNEEIHVISSQIARLQVPQQVFGRGGKGTADVEDPDADLVFSPGHTPTKKGHKRKSSFEYAPDVTGPSTSRKRSMPTIDVEVSRAGSSTSKGQLDNAASSNHHELSIDTGPSHALAATSRPRKKVGFSVDSDDDEEQSAP